MAYMPITDPQLKEFQRIAKQIGVGRDEFQAARKNGKLRHLIESLKPRLDLTKIVLPPGARLHTVRIRFKPDRAWQEAVNAAGPNTPSDYNVRKVGDQYPPTGTEEIEEDPILLNYPQGGGSWDKAQAWAKEQKLEKTVPREVFAIGEQHSQLHTVLGQNPMYVVATTECIFVGHQRACCVWWSGTKRGCCLGWVSNFDAQSGWFLFRKSVLKT